MAIIHQDQGDSVTSSHQLNEFSNSYCILGTFKRSTCNPAQNVREGVWQYEKK